MPIYEFQCPKGHVTSDLVPMDTPTIPCTPCLTAGAPPHTRAFRILSATRTNFRFNDGRLKCQSSSKQ